MSDERPLTVGELVDVLTAFDRSTPIVMEVGMMEWRSINRVHRPLENPEDEVQAAICLVGGSVNL